MWAADCCGATSSTAEISKDGERDSIELLAVSSNGLAVHDHGSELVVRETSSYGGYCCIGGGFSDPAQLTQDEAFECPADSGHPDPSSSSNCNDSKGGTAGDHGANGLAGMVPKAAGNDNGNILLLDDGDLTSLTKKENRASKGVESNCSSPTRSMNMEMTRQMSPVAAGHSGRVLKEFEENGYILKELDQSELDIYQQLKLLPDDRLHTFIPGFGGEVLLLDEEDATTSFTSGKRYLRLENILAGFKQPYVMDIKVGVRSFGEKEAASNKGREDLYEKLYKIDPDNLTPEERASKAITKLRYMTYRDSKSSTQSLGFRIDGMAGPAGLKLPSKHFQDIHLKEAVIQELLSFLPYPRKFREIKVKNDMKSRPAAATAETDSSATPILEMEGDPDVGLQAFLEANSDTLIQVRAKIAMTKLFMSELSRMRTALEQSLFFMSHEFVGSSLLFVVDLEPLKIKVVMIDFAKVGALSSGAKLTHRDPWVMGNHEDRFLFGVDTLIECWERVVEILEAEAKDIASKPAS